jgi:hypothetical protein
MTEPIIINGPEQSLVDPALPDAGLPPVVGVRSFQVFRASKDVPELSDGRGWTYHHHVDIACWRGRLYVGWNSCERDEDVWPSRELYSTSSDGQTWSEPAELFPQGASTPLRMYFFHAPNGRMLAIAGLRPNTCDTSEDSKGGLVVREIRADHQLDEVFTLRLVGHVERHPPMFDDARDATFVDACRQLLADRVFLEQQDRGRLLGERRMKWHDASAWPGGAVPGDNEKWVAGKAYAFHRRRDGVIVGISKMGWTTTSADEGATWSQPRVPTTLVTGKAKVWAQQTRDGRYALVYNPSQRNRFPLVVVTGEDGTTFRDMRVVQGELPVQRYAGLHRSIGPQYVRGISRWSDDGSRANEPAMWLVYSMNKEDIWVSRVPLPVMPDATSFEANTATWNVYRPKWADVRIDGDDAVSLHGRDPYDDAVVTHVFPDADAVEVAMEVNVDAGSEADFRIAVRERFGGAAAAAIVLSRDGVMRNGADAFGRFVPGTWQPVAIKATAAPGRLLNRMVFRTGRERGIGSATPVAPGTDHPQPMRGFRIRQLRVRRAERGA